MGVGNPQGLQHALDAAVLAPGAVQTVQHHVGPDQAGQHIGQIPSSVHTADSYALPLQRARTLLARREGHLPLRGKATHQDGDMKVFESAGHDALEWGLHV